VGRKFELKTDHIGLQHIFSQSDLNAIKRRWSELLSEYDFDINYIKGTLNKVTDALSRRPHIFSIILLNFELRYHIFRAQDEDDWCKEIRVVLYGKNICKIKMEGYSCDDDEMVRFMKKIVVPDKDGLCEMIMKEAHCSLYMAHLGVQKMYANLKQNFFWTGMRKDISIFVATCLEC
jgi:hypothetical protein